MRLRLSLGVVVVCMYGHEVECKSVEQVQILVGVFITPQTPFELRQAFRNATRGVLPRVRLVFFVGIEGNFSEEQRAHRDIVQGSRSFSKRHSKATPSAAFPKLLQSYSNAIPLTPL